MEFFQDDLGWNAKAKRRFRIIIVGAGIGGLSAAIGKLTFMRILNFAVEGEAIDNKRRSKAIWPSCNRSGAGSCDS
jgi:hypothetical protein